MKTLNVFIPFSFAVFLGAFLLFQVQPIIGKYFLPWFGGAPSVWLTCLMFFQLLLLGGYAYAHWIHKFSLKSQFLLHFGLLLTAVVVGAGLFLIWGSPILPNSSWRPNGTRSPTADILKLLTVSIGLSYFLLSSSASLLQAWFHRAYPHRSPYVFYIVSNTGSLLALLSYPILVEPHLTVLNQAWLWSSGFIIYVFLCFVCFFSIRRASFKSPRASDEGYREAIPSWGRLILWTSLSFCGVLALMSVTNQLTQNIPPVPFLWILPLSLYLLSYIVGFMQRQHNWQDLYLYLLICACGAAWYLRQQGLEADIRIQIGLYSFILTAVCLFCHNALYRSKPIPRYLTSFYLCLSVGGALGGAVCGVSRASMV